MSGMLNTLLDINQIEAGVVRPEVSVFPIGDLLQRLRDEFTYHAEAGGLELHVVACDASVKSDPALLEQMIRNLISNALKYTPEGRVLVGCRRRKGLLSVEIWDTGIGVAEEDQQAIFAEYHQVGNAARERSRGMGLGLSIVQRLAELLGHRVRVRSWPGKGSVFAIEVPIPKAQAASQPQQAVTAPEPDGTLHRKGKVLVIEDDHEVRDLLVLLLRGEGHRVAVATEAASALDFIARGGLRPDVILADYNLPGGLNGLEVIAKIRERLHERLPAIILTGDISTETLRLASAQDCIQVNKPVKLPDLATLIHDLLPPPRPARRRPTDRARTEPGRSSSSSTTIRRCARACAACWRRMADSSRALRRRKPSWPRTTPPAQVACWSTPICRG
jgi:two-component system CheB/CheR fusion protein